MYTFFQMYEKRGLSCLRLMYLKKMYRYVDYYTITIFQIAISALTFLQCVVSRLMFIWPIVKFFCELLVSSGDSCLQFVNAYATIMGFPIFHM